VKDRILALDLSLEQVGETRMRVTAFALRAGMYDLVGGAEEGNIRLHHHVMVDVPDPSAWSGSPSDLDLISPHVMMTRELSNALRSAGRDPMIVAAEALESPRIGPDDEKPFAIAHAMATTLTPAEHDRDVYLRIRTPWSPVAITIERGADTIIEEPHPEMTGPCVVDVHFHDGDLLVISTHTAIVAKRMGVVEAMRMIADHERDEGSR